MFLVCCYCYEFRSQGDCCPWCGCEAYEAATEEDRDENGTHVLFSVGEWLDDRRER